MLRAERIASFGRMRTIALGGCACVYRTVIRIITVGIDGAACAIGDGCKHASSGWITRIDRTGIVVIAFEVCVYALFG